MVSDTYLRAHFSLAYACSALCINAKDITILNSSALSFSKPQHKKTVHVVITAIVGSPAGPHTYCGNLNTDRTVLGEDTQIDFPTGNILWNVKRVGF